MKAALRSRHMLAATRFSIIQIVCDGLLTFYRVILFQSSSKSEENQECVLYSCIQNNHNKHDVVSM